MSTILGFTKGEKKKAQSKMDFADRGVAAEGGVDDLGDAEVDCHRRQRVGLVREGRSRVDEDGSICSAAIRIASSRSSPKPWVNQCVAVSSTGEEIGHGHARPTAERTSSDASIAVPQISPSPWAKCGSPTKNQRTLGEHRVAHGRARPEAPVVDVAAEHAGRDAAVAPGSAGATPITPRCGRTGTCDGSTERLARRADRAA